MKCAGLPISEPDAVSEMWLVWAKHREQSHGGAALSSDYLLRCRRRGDIKSKNVGKNVQ